MGEECRVEVQADAVLLRPFHPFAEMLGRDLVARDGLTVGFGIDFVWVLAEPVTLYGRNVLFIDGLHHFAGSHNIIEFHGTMFKNTCMDCGEKYSLEDVMSQEGVPHCKRCGGIIKPDVVLFEEGIDYNAITDSVRVTEHADLLLVIGSSLVVYPAAGIPNYFKGNNIAIINKNPTPLDGYAKLVIHDDIKKVFSELK